MGTFILIAIPLTILLIMYYAVTIWLDLGKMKNTNNGSDEETVVVPPVSDDHHSDVPEDDDSLVSDDHNCVEPEDDESYEPMAGDASDSLNDNREASQYSDDDIKPVNVTENDDGFTVGDTSYMPLLPTEPPTPQQKSIMQRIKEAESSCRDARVGFLDGMGESELSDNLLKANLTKVKKEIVIRTEPAHDRL